MNLADAIRAASHGESPLKAVAPEAPAFQPAPAKVPEPIEKTTVENNNHSDSGGNVVRLELFLHPEQMANLLRAIMAGQHTVLTLREAASYLRINAQALQKLAEEGEVPGILMDGKWRFPKSNLDDWLATRANHTEEELEDVA